MVEETSSDDSAALQFDDESDLSISDEEIVVNVGDFVIVKV